MYSIFYVTFTSDVITNHLMMLGKFNYVLHFTATSITHHTGHIFVMHLIAIGLKSYLFLVLAFK